MNRENTWAVPLQRNTAQYSQPYSAKAERLNYKWNSAGESVRTSSFTNDRVNTKSNRSEPVVSQWGDFEAEKKAVFPRGLKGSRPKTGGNGNEAVKNYMNKTVLTMSAGQTIFDACNVMRKTRLGCVLVMDDDRPVGIITESTIVKHVALGSDFMTRLERVMSQPLVTITPDQHIADALAKLHQHHIRRLPVVQYDKLLGIITQTDLLEASFRMLNRLRNNERRLSKIAHFDELTGLYNRRYFRIVFRDELSRTRSFGGLLTLVLIDIDRYKEINDLYGHEAGDEILRQMAAIVRNNAREVDIVARYGGDAGRPSRFSGIRPPVDGRNPDFIDKNNGIGDGQSKFVALLPGLGTRAAFIFADKCRETINSTVFRFKGKRIQFTISAGICKWTKQVDSITLMMNEADKCLYRAKDAGRNNVMVSY